MQDQIKYKDVQVQQLKTELISQKEEKEELAEEFEETREDNHDMNT